MTQILLVDDDTDILEILRLEFEDDPECHADTATGVASALALAREHSYDAIITDWRMPVMNGTVFVSTLRRQGCKSPIIIYSGIDMDLEIKKTLEAGADFFIPRRGDPSYEFGELKKILKKVSVLSKRDVKK
ncbi:MAG TPA: response regulator [Methanoregula sp.]|nr:response regulator [Methanoregula sp.]